MSFSKLSLLWKIMLPASIVVTVVFALAGWLIQDTVARTTSASVEREAKASFAAYTSLWKARADFLASESKLLSAMSDVRAAFGTGDRATIRDTAGEIWDRTSNTDAFFIVADPRGRMIAASGAPAPFSEDNDIEAVREARRQFPGQASGFLLRSGELFQIVITPVYVESAGGLALLDVLVAGYKVDSLVAAHLKQSTGGSDFAFTAGGQVLTSTLPRSVAAALAPHSAEAISRSPDYITLATPLLNIEGSRIGDLIIARSFEDTRRAIAALRREILLLWLGAIAAALAVTYAVARRIMRPVAELDRAAAEIARRNYDTRVAVHGDDEIGRLARTFNNMCASIQSSREELIRQERISTIGRLSTSIVHDLRNPLAAVYAGAEMLMDGHLKPEQIARLARNIYRASRGIQDMLQQLLNVSRRKSSSTEPCDVRELIDAAWAGVAVIAEPRAIRLSTAIPEHLECPMERARMERVFLNLFENAIEAMSEGGSITVKRGQGRRARADFGGR